LPKGFSRSKRMFARLCHEAIIQAVYANFTVYLSAISIPMQEYMNT
jgi:hypothetical protein